MGTPIADVVFAGLRHVGPAVVGAAAVTNLPTWVGGPERSAQILKATGVSGSRARAAIVLPLFFPLPVVLAINFMSESSVLRALGKACLEYPALMGAHVAGVIAWHAACLVSEPVAFGRRFSAASAAEDPIDAFSDVEPHVDPETGKVTFLAPLRAERLGRFVAPFVSGAVTYLAASGIFNALSQYFG